MTKTELLELIKLLSALESWSFTSKTEIPKYLHEALCGAVNLLTKEVLK